MGESKTSPATYEQTGRTYPVQDTGLKFTNVASVASYLIVPVLAGEIFPLAREQSKEFKVVFILFSDFFHLKLFFHFSFLIK